MSDQDRYASPRAVEQAIKDAAKTAHEADPSRLVDDLIAGAVTGTWNPTTKSWA